MTLQTALIIQTVVGAIGLIPSYLLGMATVMSAANATKTPRLGAALVFTGLALPFTLGISLIAMWIAHSFGFERTALSFLIAPWAHFGLLVGGMLFMFSRQA